MRKTLFGILLAVILLAFLRPYAFAADRAYVQLMVKPTECKTLGDITGDIPLAVLKKVPVTVTVDLYHARALHEHWSPDLVMVKDGLINMWYHASAAEMMFGKYREGETEHMVSMWSEKAERICIKNNGIMYIDRRALPERENDWRNSGQGLQN